MSTLNLQQIIGISKRNPDITLWTSDTDPDKLYVFWGALLLETVPNDKNSPGFKLLLGRLYNSGMTAKNLTEEFGVARTTMKRWGEALQRGSIEILLRDLHGPGRPRKLTDEIIAFTKLRFQDLYQESHYRYSQKIREEIKEVFQIEFSGESLRPIFTELKSSLNNKNIFVDSTCNEEEERAITCELEQEAEEAECMEAPVTPIEKSNLPEPVQSKAQPAQNQNRKKSLAFYKNEEQWVFCHHVGVLILSSLISKLQGIIKSNRLFIQQVLITVLLGAKNIEQTKILDFDSLGAFLGSVFPNLRAQRTSLSGAASSETIADLLSYNAFIVRAGECSDFYYDPHTKHYTGMQKILKGWCPSAHGIRKVLHMDFIHTHKGYPVFIRHDDNFYDLRERYDTTINNCEKLLGISSEKSITYIVDRGIYKINLFEKIYRGKNHIITWEKGYEKGQWDDSQIKGSFFFARKRNHSTDLMFYKFEYIDSPWDKNSHIRQLIVRATNPKNKIVEVSILADDQKRCPEEIILLMFSRWIQENDFKYLKSHFGIDEITSYKVIPYQKLKEMLKDKNMKTGEYKALEVSKNKIHDRLKKLLLMEHKRPEKSKKRIDEIEVLSQKMGQVENELKSTKKETSRLQALIDEEYVKLDTTSKSLMDTIKILARNVFYLALQPFKEMYDNYRDDHVIFRCLTQSHGCVAFRQNVVEVTLFPTIGMQPKLKKIIETVLFQINENKPHMLDDSGRIIQFKLGKKTSKLFAIQID